MKHCPHCGDQMPDHALLCANCSDAVATDDLFRALTLDGRLSDDAAALFVVGALALGAMMVVGVIGLLAWLVWP